MEVEVKQPHEKVNDSLRVIMLRNFVGGISWAVGITIGFSLLIAILRFLSNNIDVVPIIGTFVSNIIDFVLSYNKHL